jgi:hypothetical protein
VALRLNIPIATKDSALKKAAQRLSVTLL